MSIEALPFRIERLAPDGAFDPVPVGELAGVARGEGFVFLDRLLAEWESGAERFEGPGEILFGAFVGEALVGTGGLTGQRAGLGRVRRMYVHPEFRRRGIAAALLEAVIAEARAHHRGVVLYTETPEAAALYEREGFRPESPDGPDHAIHRLALTL